MREVPVPRAESREPSDTERQEFRGRFSLALARCEGFEPVLVSRQASARTVRSKSLPENALPRLLVTTMSPLGSTEPRRGIAEILMRG